MMTPLPQTRVKEMLLLSGLSRRLFWFSFFIAHHCLFWISVAIGLIVGGGVRPKAI